MSFNARSLGVEATMASPASEALVGDSFRVTTRALHVFWGLYPARQPNLQNVLAGQLAGGGSIRSLSIRVRRKWSDVLVTALSLGVLNPTSVTFEGVIMPRRGP